MGPIQAGDGLTIPEFIADAFNDEFKFADIYDQNRGIKLSGKVDKIEFSSSKGLTQGWWDLYVTLKSPNGNTVSVGTHSASTWISGSRFSIQHSHRSKF